MTNLHSRNFFRKTKRTSPLPPLRHPTGNHSISFSFWENPFANKEVFPFHWNEAAIFRCRFYSCIRSWRLKSDRHTRTFSIADPLYRFKLYLSVRNTSKQAERTDRRQLPFLNHSPAEQVLIDMRQKYCLLRFRGIRKPGNSAPFFKRLSPQNPKFIHSFFIELQNVIPRNRTLLSAAFSDPTGSL